MNSVSFSARHTNLGLLALVSLGVASGLGCFLAGSAPLRWVFAAHGAVGFSLIVLLYWKRRIILRSVQRLGAGLWLVPFALLLVLLLASLLSGVLWSTSGLPSLAGESGLTLHAGVSLVFAALLAPHARAGWPRVPARPALSRRALFSSGFVLAAGVAAWRGTELTAWITQLSGSRRRFTGSRDAGGFNGNLYPANAWLLDDPAPLDRAAWRLLVTGRVRLPSALRLDQLGATQEVVATLDCTGGWYSAHRWQGVSVGNLLAQAGTDWASGSMVVRSSTGYWRRFSISSARTMLLATAVDGEPIEHEHGAPLRLVAPGRRGYDWVKWVTTIEVSAAPSWLNWPLPLH